MNSTTNAPADLEGRIAAFGDPLTMLRSSPAGRATFPMQSEYTNWRDEQAAWTTTTTIFDQGQHMTEVVFDGPELIPLLERTGINSFDGFGPGQAKQFVGVNGQGQVIGDAILFSLGEHRASLVGPPFVSRWVQYTAETGGFDVHVIRDEWSGLNTGRRNFRFQVQGPHALEIVGRAAGTSAPDIPFFRIGELEIDGVPTFALSHSMSRRSGLELWGPRIDGPRVLARLLGVGEEFGVRMGGALAYSTTGLESGWWGMQLPAIYSDPTLAEYRSTIELNSLEAGGSIGGSYVSDDIDDYYMSPWDLGYGRLIGWEHDFIGRDALLAQRDQPHRRKVWLRWNDDDVAAINRDALFADVAERPKLLRLPNAVDSTYPADAVWAGDRRIGVSGRVGYTESVGHVYSLATVEESEAVDGAELEVVWGDDPDLPARPGIEPHTTRRVRATLSTTRLA